jgi:hypothetical protein
MTSKERLQSTLSHKHPGKLVVDFGSTAVTGIHVLAIKRLREHYGLENKPVKVIEPYQMLGEIDEDLAGIIGIDTIGVLGPRNMFGIKNYGEYKTSKTFWGQEVLLPENFNTQIDGNGDLVVFPKGDFIAPPSAKMPKQGYFFDAIVRQHEIIEDRLDVNDNLEEFTPVTENDLSYWESVAMNAASLGKGVVATFGGTALGDIALVPGMQLKDPKGIRDIAEWYMSTMMRPNYVKCIFESQTEIALQNLEKYNDRVGNLIDVVFICGTDFGTQNSTFCSTDHFKELWLPYYRKINDWIHENTCWKTMKHSCGAVESFMPYFIDAGFDILNPVQINAFGMAPLHLKKTYGKDITFWGGGVDTQKILPYAEPQVVKDEIKKLIDIFGEDGGFVFNAVHNIQANVPTANLVAMIETIQSYR